MEDRLLSNEFLRSKQDLLDGLSEMTSNITIHYNDASFSRDELIYQIQSETEFGINHVEMYIKSLEKIKTIRNKYKK